MPHSQQQSRSQKIYFRPVNIPCFRTWSYAWRGKKPKSFVFCPPSAVSLPLQACFFWRNLKKGGGNFDFPNATALNFPFKFVLRFFALPAKLEQTAKNLFSPHSNNRPHHACGGVQRSYTSQHHHTFLTAIFTL